jgi:hypothetical protein
MNQIASSTAYNRLSKRWRREMFSVEIKINGAMIIHIYGHNKGSNGAGKTLYDYEVYEVASRALAKGEVAHERSAGIAPLLVKILKDYKCT